MTETTTIRLEDMHRRDNARALDAAEVEELTASIKALGFKTSEPITLRRDGDIYWIIDGGHRHAAALAAGLTEAPAVVEDLDDAGALTHEGALNIQRADTVEERWARAQSFLALGKAAKPELVQVATGLDAETWAAVKKARKVVADGTAFEDCSLFDIPVINALEDDKAALAEYLKVPAKSRQYRGDRILEEIRLAAKAAAFVAECEAAGVVIITDGADTPDGYRYIGGTGPSLDQRPADAVAVRVSGMGGSYLHIQWYAEASAEDTDAQKAKAAAKEERAAREAALEAAADARLAFIAANVDTGKELKKVAVAAWESSHELPDEFASLTGTYSRMLAYELNAVARLAEFALDRPTDDWSRKEYGPKAIALMKALVADGYELTDEEAAALKLLTAKPKKAKKVTGDE